MRNPQGTRAFRVTIVKTAKNWKTSIITLICITLILITTALIAQTGLWFIFPTNARLIWLAITTPITAVGFYFWQAESCSLRNVKHAQLRSLVELDFIYIMPFILIIGLYTIIGSISGILGAIHGILILSFVIFAGNLSQSVGKNKGLSALFQAFLLQWILLPQCVLFTMFFGG